MAMRSATDDWGIVTKILHWTMAAGILTMLGCEILMAWFLDNDIGLKFSVYQFHKSLGFVLLCIASLRIFWRLSATNTPHLPSGMAPLQHRLADGVHLGLYGCLVAQPVIGWAAASASPLNIPTIVLGLFTLPRLGGPDAVRERLLSETHTVVAWLLIALLSLRAAGALWHHLALGDDTLRRMLFGRRATFTNSD